MLKRIFFKIARSSISRYFIGRSFQSLSFLMPLTRIIDNPDVVAFHHPVKYWQAHSLIVPKKAVPTFATLCLTENHPHQKLLLAILQAAQAAAQREGFSEYALLVNGGTSQDVPQLHFHLASGPTKDGSHPGDTTLLQLPTPHQLICKTNTLCAYQMPPNHPGLHIAIVPQKQHSAFHKMNLQAANHQEILLQSFALAQNLIVQFKPAGYTLITHAGYGQQLFAVQILGNMAPNNS